ncbi:MAG TPA: type II secretion system protein [Candidatus Paceibacterota bacterium]|nr:type II secretion system protein [Candidatus Paceibacterota bacterium]
MQRTTRGFTLIELLVVIAIIGILSSVVLSSLNTARAKARDANRMAALKSIMLALELYYDKYGYYPASNSTNNTWGRDCGGWRGDNTPNTFLKPLADEGFLQYYDDPVAGDCKIQYRSQYPADNGPGQGYRIVIHMETKPNTNLACYNDPYWYCVGVNYQ